MHMHCAIAKLRVPIRPFISSKDTSKWKSRDLGLNDETAASTYRLYISIYPSHGVHMDVSCDSVLALHWLMVVVMTCLALSR